MSLKQTSFTTNSNNNWLNVIKGHIFKIGINRRAKVEVVNP